ncbi:hypothetical protein ACTFIW_003233 [Dictyostelium discoideum]
MVMTISPTFQFFSNYFKTAWDYLSNNNYSELNNNNNNKNNNKNNNNKNNNFNNNNNNNNNNNYNNNNNNKELDVNMFFQDQQFEDITSILDSPNGINLFFEEFKKEQELLEFNNINNNNNIIIEEDNIKNNFIDDNKLITLINNNQEIIQANHYVYRALSWLLKHDSYYVMNNDNYEIHQLIFHSISCVKNILELHEIPSTFLPIVIMYADNFVKRCGINNKQLLNLLISSSIVCVKFYGESVAVDHKVLGGYFNLTSKDLCYMERLFLNGINFQLYSNNSQVLEFLDSIEKEKQSFVI